MGRCLEIISFTQLVEQTEMILVREVSGESLADSTSQIFSLSLTSLHSHYPRPYPGHHCTSPGVLQQPGCRSLSSSTLRSHFLLHRVTQPFLQHAHLTISQTLAKAHALIWHNHLIWSLSVSPSPTCLHSTLAHAPNPALLALLFMWVICISSYNIVN